ncbi:MAG: hypothetical protein HQL79_09255 [Magnetococcales bacterium]|nr:hypothetical protein [Magnetococcales bacterium]
MPNLSDNLFDDEDIDDEQKMAAKLADLAESEGIQAIVNMRLANSGESIDTICTRGFATLLNNVKLRNIV